MDASPYQLYADLLTEDDRADLALFDCGPSVLLLYVHQKNAAAIKLYQHFGFTAYPTARTDDHILMTQRLEVE